MNDITDESILDCWAQSIMAWESSGIEIKDKTCPIRMRDIEKLLAPIIVSRKIFKISN